MKQLTLWPNDHFLEPKAAVIVKRRGPKAKLAPRARNTSRSVNLVLASGSQSKSEVLGLLGLTFVIDPANIDEQSISCAVPTELVMELAYRKAFSVAQKYDTGLILGADTVVADAQGVIGKPRNLADARTILQRLSGRKHSVITGIALLDRVTGKCVRKSAKTWVTFRKLSIETIDRYIATGEPMGKAGGYGLQGIGAILVKNVEGEYPNVFGMPIVTLVDALAELDYELI